MAMTNFGKLTDEQSTVWARAVWREARQTSFFLNNFAGDSKDAMLHRISELREVKGQARAVITLVPDLEGDGVVGDNQLEGNEEEIKAFDQVVEFDQMRNANRLEGRMVDLRSIVRFRENSRNLLSHWLATRLDEQIALILSGVSFNFRPNGAARIGSQWNQLAYAGYITPPSANRHFRWDVDSVAGNSLQPGDTAQVAAGDLPSWQMLVHIKAKAVESRIRPIRTADGIEMYNVFMNTRGIAALKQDPDFLNAWTHAQKQGDGNPIFKGTPHGGRSGFFIDGLRIMEYENVYNTLGIPPGQKWGGGSVDGERILVCGAQAMGLADIGLPRWVEKDFDYDNSPGISIAKLFGALKPVWQSSQTGTKEDFGLFVVDTAIK